MVGFGNRLKTLRLEFGFTQKQLADKLGVTKSVVSYYEQQERNPSPEILIQLSYIFRTTTDYLLGLDNRMMIDVSDLMEEDIAVIRGMIDVLKKKNR